MLSLGFFARQKENEEVSNVANYAAGSRRVLPRLLRKPARLFNKLISGNVVVTQRGWVSILLVGGLIAGAGAFLNMRQGHSVVAEMSAGLGFTIDGVIVEGNSELSKVDVVTRLDLGPSKSLFTFDIARARDDLQKLAWVKDAIVAKAYPNRLVIHISEREPFAIWQKGNSLAVIERDGVSIERYDERFADLPLLVGEGANVRGAEIIYQTSKIALLNDSVKAFVRIGNRRWDLRLKNGMTIRLPDSDLAVALGQLVRLDDEHNLLARDIRVVDLRLKDRLVISLSEEATQKRAALADEANKIGEEKKI